MKGLIDQSMDYMADHINKAYFYVNQLTATTISSSGSDVKIPITGMSSGSGFEYDSTNKGIKCRKTGRYIISAQINMDTSTSGDLIGISIYKNGSASIGPAYVRMSGTNYDSALLLPTICNLSSGDYLTLYLRNNSAARGKNGAGPRIMCWEI